jgi:hypothetical protein
MKKIALLLFGISVIFSACRGPVGPPGPRGFDGNANVFAFNYFVNPNDWVQNGVQGNPNFGYYAPFALPELDDIIFEDGAILVYMFDGAMQLPLPNIDNQNGFQTIYDYALRLGEIDFWVRESDNFTEPPAFQIEYKVILIDGLFKNHETLKEMTLEEIESYFKITEYTTMTP